VPSQKSFQKPLWALKMGFEKPLGFTIYRQTVSTGFFEKHIQQANSGFWKPFNRMAAAKMI
jgi:hypothetical protein